MLSQGGRANKQGRIAENTIEGVIRSYAPSAKILPRTKIGTTIYGHALEVDRLVLGLPRFPDGLAIESKWQDSKGSADEKFPYLVENIRRCYPCPVIIVADGSGARPGAIRWLREQVDGEHLLAVLTIAEFMTWCSRNL